MRMLVVMLIILSATVGIAAPRFVTPGMIQRNGLTDEQYERLWAQGKRPQITIDAARDWIFRSARYQNVTNWLDVIGKTNNFARLVVPTMATNETLRTENGNLKTENKHWKHVAEENANDARTAREIRAAAKRTAKNLEKVLEALEQAKKKAETEDEAALYTMLIALLEGKEPNQ